MKWDGPAREGTVKGELLVRSTGTEGIPLSTAPTGEDGFTTGNASEGEGQEGEKWGR